MKADAVNAAPAPTATVNLVVTKRSLMSFFCIASFSRIGALFCKSSMPAPHGDEDGWAEEEQRDDSDSPPPGR
jgi:hypothetical protein